MSLTSIFDPVFSASSSLIRSYPLLTTSAGLLLALKFARWISYRAFWRSANAVRGKQFVVTGACGGLGSVVCRRLAEQGADTIVLWDTRQATMSSLRAELLGINPKLQVITFKVNLLDSKAIRAACCEIFADSSLSIDVLVCCAGVAFCGLIGDISEEQDRDMLQTNYLSQVELIKQFLPYMEKNGKGHIASVVSMASFSGGCGMSTYCASKFALRGFLEGLASELIYRGSPVSLSIFCPGVFDSKLFEGFEMPFPIIGTLRCSEVADAFIRDSMERRFAMSMYPSYLSPLGPFAVVANVLGWVLTVPIHVTRRWKSARYVMQSLEKDV